MIFALSTPVNFVSNVNMGGKKLKIEFLGKEYSRFTDCYNDHRDIAVVTLGTFRARILTGMPVREALTTPNFRVPNARAGSHIVEGVEYPSLVLIARAYDLNEMVIYKRYSRGLRGDDLVPLKKRKSYVPPAPKTPKRQVEIRGVTYKNLATAIKTLGISKHTFKRRRHAGHSIEQSLGLEPFPDKRRLRAQIYEYRGEKLSLTDIENRFGLYSKTFTRRLARGLSVEEALAIEKPGKLNPKKTVPGKKA